MALVLDATPGGAAANSYATRAEADSYHEGHYYSSAWTALTTTQKDIALVMATRLLDEHVEWHGTKTTRGQALRWPRIGVRERDSMGLYPDPYYGYTLNSSTIPLFLKQATAELGRHLASEDRTTDADLLEFSQISVGSLSLVKDQTRQQQVIPDSVRAMVKPYGAVSGSGLFGTLRLVRA